MRSIKQLFGLFSLLFISFNLLANDFHVHKNEKLVFGFITEKNNKILSISMDNKNQYIVYRYGSEKRVELEYPEELSNSFDKFIYSYYLRGGPNNEGIDLNYLRFYNGNYEYVIYHEYVAENSKISIGVNIRNIKSSKTIDIKGKPESIEGSLVDLRFIKSIKTDSFQLNR